MSERFRNSPPITEPTGLPALEAPRISLDLCVLEGADYARRSRSKEEVCSSGEGVFCTKSERALSVMFGRKMYRESISRTLHIQKQYIVVYTIPTVHTMERGKDKLQCRAMKK